MFLDGAKAAPDTSHPLPVAALSVTQTHEVMTARPSSLPGSLIQAPPVRRKFSP
jgi:hypothetical protein